MTLAEKFTGNEGEDTRRRKTGEIRTHDTMVHLSRGSGVALKRLEGLLYVGQYTKNFTFTISIEPRNASVRQIR